MTKLDFVVNYLSRDVGTLSGVNALAEKAGYNDADVARTDLLAWCARNGLWLLALAGSDIEDPESPYNLNEIEAGASSGLTLGITDDLTGWGEAWELQT